MSHVNVDGFRYDLHNLPIPSASLLSLEALLTQSGGPCSSLHPRVLGGCAQAQRSGVTSPRSHSQEATPAAASGFPDWDR